MLLERAAQLEELAEHLRQAAAGRGRLVLIGGEAGVGKSTLVDEFCLHAQATARALKASCDSLSTPGPFGPLLDIAPALGIDLSQMFMPNQRRDEVFHTVLTALSSQADPTIIVGEDAHWSDEATLDLLRFLSRRIDNLGVLVLVTYRDDELSRDHPLRRLLGDLATASTIFRMNLSPLSLDAVRTLTRESRQDPKELFHRTGGNPFFLSEVLALPEQGLPPTVSDAVLARASRLSPDGRAVLDVSAVIGATIETNLLLSVGGPVIGEVEECIDMGLLRPNGEELAFRHELAREAVLSTISAPRRRLLHRRILDVMLEDPVMSHNYARLAHHADAGGAVDAVCQYARAAAEQAMMVHSYREAAAQFRRLLRAMGSEADSERAPILENYSFSCYLSAQGNDAIAARREAIEIWQQAGNTLKVGDNLRWLSRLLWFEGHSVEAQRAGLDALEVLEALPPGPELALAYSNMSQLEMLRWNIDETIVWGEKAIRLAEQFEQHETIVHAMINVGTARATRNDPESWKMLRRGHQMAMEAGMVDHAGRALVNLAWSEMWLYQFDNAQRDLEEALAYATKFDLDNYFWYLLAGRAHLNCCLGRWDAALEDAGRVLALPSISALTRIVALTVRGTIVARRGDDGASSMLDEALELAEQTGELQRLGPVRIARAEAAWLAGDNERSLQEASSIRDLAEEYGTPWVRGAVVHAIRRAGGLCSPALEIAEPYALMIDAEWRRAARVWERIGCLYERALALLESDDEVDLREAALIFASLGAHPAEQRAKQRLREIGVRPHQRGPNVATRANPAGLTQREIDVLELLSGGLTNAEIAEKLFISPKTVGHHVSAILAKLSVGTRSAAVRRAAELGIPNPQK